MNRFGGLSSATRSRGFERLHHRPLGAGGFVSIVMIVVISAVLAAMFALNGIQHLGNLREGDRILVLKNLQMIQTSLYPSLNCGTILTDLRNIDACTNWTAWQVQSGGTLPATGTPPQEPGLSQGCGCDPSGSLCANPCFLGIESFTVINNTMTINWPYYDPFPISFAPPPPPGTFPPVSQPSSYFPWIRGRCAFQVSASGQSLGVIKIEVQLRDLFNQPLHLLNQRFIGRDGWIDLYANTTGIENPFDPNRVPPCAFNCPGGVCQGIQ